MKKLALIAVLAAASMPAAFAGDFYVAASVGRSSLDINKSDVDGELIAVGVTGINSSLDKTDNAYKIQLGYQFNSNFALEGGYVDLGKAKYSASFTGGSAHAEVKASGLALAALGILPLNESFSLFCKLGVINGKIEENVSATGPGGSASASVSATKWKASWGAGATYHFTKQLGLRVEYEQFRKLGDANTTGEGNVDFLSAGVVYKF